MLEVTNRTANRVSGRRHVVPISCGEVRPVGRVVVRDLAGTVVVRSGDDVHVEAVLWSEGRLGSIQRGIQQNPPDSNRGDLRVVAGYC